MDTRAKSRMRTPIASALDAGLSGRDVLSALAAAWSSSNGAPTVSVAGRPGVGASAPVPVAAVLPVRFNAARRVTALAADQAPLVRRRVAGR